MTRIGQIVAGRHRILERIGAGAMGEVFRATPVDGVGDDVAIKMLRPERSREREPVERFLAEIRATRALSHPSIVQVLSEGETEEHTPYVVMELLRGEALRTTLQRHGKFDRATALSILLPVLEALEEAHAHGLIHRDVKPENVHLSTSAKGDVAVKVLDFGIAKVLDAALAIGHKTTAGIVVGTPGYFSPEQAVGDRQLDGRADLFAVGAILFELLSGVRAFDGPSPVVAAWKVVSEPAPRLVDKGVEGADDLQNVLDRALAKRPDDRFPSARAFLDAIGPLAPSLVGRRVLLSSLLLSPGRGKRPPPPASSDPFSPDLPNVHLDRAIVRQSSRPPVTGFLPTMRSTLDPLAERLDAAAESKRRAVRFAEESSTVGTPALVVLETPSSSLAPVTAAPSPYDLPAAARGKHRARAGWIRSVVTGLESVRSGAEVASWIEALPATEASAVRAASLDPDTWTSFDALHALVAIATERAFGGDATAWRAHVRDHAQDLAARLDHWSIAGGLDAYPEGAPTWPAWWPNARATLLDVGVLRVEGANVTAANRHVTKAKLRNTAIVQVDNVSPMSRSIRHAELGLLEAALARAGFPAANAEALSGDSNFGQEFRYRVTWA